MYQIKFFSLVYIIAVGLKLHTHTHTHTNTSTYTEGCSCTGTPQALQYVCVCLCYSWPAGTSGSEWQPHTHQSPDYSWTRCRLDGWEAGGCWVTGGFFCLSYKDITSSPIWILYDLKMLCNMICVCVCVCVCVCGQSNSVETHKRFQTS